MRSLNVSAGEQNGQAGAIEAEHISARAAHPAIHKR
jgi:hypothetical protein